VAIEETKHGANYGFITVVEIADLGFCGGLLVLSENGRPQEFHCTAPVNANRAQQILYGKTLNGFLFCDQIGLALYDKVKAPLDLLVTDMADLLELADAANVAVALVNSNEPIQASTEKPVIAETTIRVAEGSTKGRQQAESLVKQFRQTLPLNEPFERIHRAIEEAHAVAQ